MKIVFLDRITVGDIPAITMLEKYGEVVIYEKTMPDQTVDRVKNAEVVISNKVILDKQVIDQAAHLKLICIAATGMNNVDVEYANSKEIEVKNVRDYSTESVAQATFAMLFQLLNKTSYFDNYVKSGEYANSDVFTHHGRSFWQLTNKEFGIIGLGTIGRRVAAIAIAFGGKVSYYSTSGKNKTKDFQQKNLHDLLKTSDIVSIHAPLNENTNGLIGYDELKLMKKESYLVNMGRGGIVKEADLARAINEDIIAGAALDVFVKEPIEKDNPLLLIHNPEKLVLSPHVAWASIEARTSLMEIICKNINDFILDK